MSDLPKRDEIRRHGGCNRIRRHKSIGHMVEKRKIEGRDKTLVHPGCGTVNIQHCHESCHANRHDGPDIVIQLSKEGPNDQRDPFFTK